MKVESPPSSTGIIRPQERIDMKTATGKEISLRNFVKPEGVLSSKVDLNIETIHLARVGVLPPPERRWSVDRVGPCLGMSELLEPTEGLFHRA